MTGTECQHFVLDEDVNWGDEAETVKGVCKCGSFWFEHRIAFLPFDDREDACRYQELEGIVFGPLKPTQESYEAQDRILYTDIAETHQNIQKLIAKIKEIEKLRNNLHLAAISEGFKLNCVSRT